MVQDRKVYTSKLATHNRLVDYYYALKDLAFNVDINLLLSQFTVVKVLETINFTIDVSLLVLVL